MDSRSFRLHSSRLSSQAVEVEGAVEYGTNTRPQIQLASGATLRLEVLREIPNDASLRRQWNALVARTDQPQVFYTWEWAFAVQHAYSSSLSPLLFLAYDEQQSLRGVVALATDANGKRGSFLSATTGDYCDFLSSPEDKPRFVSEVLAGLRKRGIDDIVLTNLPADSDTVPVLRRASVRNRYHFFERTAYECAQILFNRLDRGEDGKPLAPGKKRIRRLAKAMANEGTVEFGHSRSWDEVAPVLPQFIKAHVIRFLEIGRISNLADERRREFLTELSQLLSRPQWLVLSHMSVGRRVFAWHYGFQFHDSWFWYQPTFDSSVEKHWPGFCLLTRVIQDATENSALTKLDLGLGSENYKAKFANATRRTLCVTLHRSVGKHWQGISRYRTSEAVKKYPKVENLARSTLKHCKTFQRRLHDSGVLKAALWVCGRAVTAIAGRDEVLFYEYLQPGPQAQTSPDRSLALIDMNLLAAAAMQHADEETLSYLVRCARRLKSGDGSTGFAMSDGNGKFVQFTWARPFEGFHFAELRSAVPPPAPNAAILFDSWSPASHRDYGFRAEMLEAVAERLRSEGKRVWSFDATTNLSSIPGMEKAGWRTSFAVHRFHFLGWRRVIQRNRAACPSGIEGPLS